MGKTILMRSAALVLLLAIVFTGCSRSGPQATDPPVQTEAPETTDPTAEVMGPTEPKPTEPHWVTFPEDRQLTAKQYFVYDAEAEKFLTISGPETEKIFPASVTKVFTAYFAMQYIKPDQEITVGNVLDLVAPGSSVASLSKGDVLTGEQLAQAMLLPSGNDAAYVLAAEAGKVIAGDDKLSPAAAVKTFVDRMNEHARAQGMTGTHFANPDGIHKPNHYSCPADLAKMATLALQNETILKYAGMPRATVELLHEQMLWENTNALIHPDSPFYCPYAVGLKTGQTPYAGSCLLSAFRYQGRTLVVGVFGCPLEEDRFADSLQLFNDAVGYKG